jgi:hypothetical protein
MHILFLQDIFAMKEEKVRSLERSFIRRARAGIQGLDEITEGGLPADPARLDRQ